MLVSITATRCIWILCQNKRQLTDRNRLEVMWRHSSAVSQLTVSFIASFFPLRQSFSRLVCDLQKLFISDQIIKRHLILAPRQYLDANRILPNPLQYVFHRTLGSELNRQQLTTIEVSIFQRLHIDFHHARYRRLTDVADWLRVQGIWTAVDDLLFDGLLSRKPDVSESVGRRAELARVKGW